MVFATDIRIQLQHRLDRDASDTLVTSSWCASCGEDEPSTTCENETSEATFARKPIFAPAHPSDGGESLWTD